MKSKVLLLYALISVPVFSATYTGKFYVAEIEGISIVTKDEKGTDLKEKDIYTAANTIISTESDSFAALVLSNSTSIFLAQDTAIKFDDFNQDNFLPGRLDIDSEPSRSSAKVKQISGIIGICTGILYPGTDLIIKTPQCNIRLTSGKKQQVAIEVTDKGLVVAQYNGSTIATIENSNIVIEAGNILTINGSISVNKMTKEQIDKYEELIASSCQSRKKAYFDVTSKEVIEVVEILGPLNPKETGTIVSPSRPN